MSHHNRTQNVPPPVVLPTPIEACILQLRGRTGTLPAQMTNAASTKARLRKYLVEVIVLALGVAGVIAGVELGQPTTVVLVGLGCSLIASSIVSLLATRFYARMSKTTELLALWGLRRIFRTRQEKNAHSDSAFRKLRKRFDSIAWGLNSFRSSDKVLSGALEEKIVQGLQVRMLAPDPDGPFVLQQDRDEGKLDGYTGDSIRRLKEWADDLCIKTKKRKARGSIELRFYEFRPQDFYFRLDDILYTGPYLFGVDSQQTISFVYEGPSRGFELYAEHFERVWAASAPEARAARKRSREPTGPTGDDLICF